MAPFVSSTPSSLGGSRGYRVLKSPNRFSKSLRKGCKFSSDCKQTVLSVYARRTEMHLSMTKMDIYKLTSDYTGVGPRTVVVFKRKPIANNGVLRAPTGKSPRAVGTRCHAVTYDIILLTALRSVVRSLFWWNEIPSIKKNYPALMEALEKNENVRVQLFYSLPPFT